MQAGKQAGTLAAAVQCRGGASAAAPRCSLPRALRPLRPPLCPSLFPGCRRQPGVVRRGARGAAGD